MVDGSHRDFSVISILHFPVKKFLKNAGFFAVKGLLQYACAFDF